MIEDAEVCPRTLDPGTPVADAAMCSPDPQALPAPPDLAPSLSVGTWLVSWHPSVWRDCSQHVHVAFIPFIRWPLMSTPACRLQPRWRPAKKRTPH